MQNESEWNLIYSQFLRDDNQPLQHIIIPTEINKHTIRIEANATEIPDRWKTAGWLYHRLSHYQDVKRDIAGEYRVLVNTRQIITLPVLTNVLYLEYLPARWYLWQDVKIWLWIRGE